MTYDKRWQAEGHYDDCFVRNIGCVRERRVGTVSWLVRDLRIRAAERYLTDRKVVCLPVRVTHQHWINTSISHTLPTPTATVLIELVSVSAARLLQCNPYFCYTNIINNNHNYQSSSSSRPTQPSIPLRSVNEYQLRLGMQRQVWFNPLADERGV